jgi:hypothetical protein
LEIAMTDGPFKNLRLGIHWKRFAEAVQNDAVDSTERCALGSDALIRDILTDDTRALLRDLQSYVNQDQLEFDPLSSVESIFDGHSKSPFADTFQKELVFRLSGRISPDIAIRKALESSVSDQISKAANRIEEECIRARETGEMWRDQFDCTVVQARKTFDALARSEICDALLAGNKYAFKCAVSKRHGLDEGPRL